MRPKDTLLEALALFRGLNASITVNEIMSFLYTCENEGLSVQELAFVAQMTEPTASRSIRSFGPQGAEWARAPACGLVEFEHTGLNQRGEVVAVCRRTALMKIKPAP